MTTDSDAKSWIITSELLVDRSEYFLNEGKNIFSHEVNQKANGSRVG